MDDLARPSDEASSAAPRAEPRPRRQHRRRCRRDACRDAPAGGRAAPDLEQRLREKGSRSATPIDVPTARDVRSISVATLASRFATWDAVVAARRVSLADAADRCPRSRGDPVRCGSCWSTRVARRHRQGDRPLRALGAHRDDRDHRRSRRVLAPRDSGSLAVMLRHAGEHTSLGSYARMIPPEDRPALRERRSPSRSRRSCTAGSLRGSPRPSRARGDAVDSRYIASVPAGWRPRTILDRFRGAFGAKLSIVPAPEPPALTSLMEAD